MDLTKDAFTDGTKYIGLNSLILLIYLQKLFFMFGHPDK